MSTSPIQSTNVIQELATAITRKLDADGDGKLSTTEFSGFLTEFLGALQANPLRNTASSAVNTATTSATTNADRPVVGKFSGYSAAKLADVSHTSTKYMVGRILQYYPNTPAGLREALPEIQQVFPTATIAGSKGDKLDFGNYVDPKGNRIGMIDIIQSAGLGGTKWQWLPVNKK